MKIEHRILISKEEYDEYKALKNERQEYLKLKCVIPQVIDILTTINLITDSDVERQCKKKKCIDLLLGK